MPIAPEPDIPQVALSEEAQRLYLNYAFSVIMGRALPDVRDGLKPVQRRILYAMHNELRVGPDSKPVKCASIVGDVIGKYHPHGDSAIYEALVRQAQAWVMRAPLVDGQGNFGSLDGDAPAAYRYTEAKLTKVAMELLTELGKKTVSFRPTFDGTRFEPVVLPARFPNLLVNGSQGIAVGMATSIPPHNLVEVVDALTLLIDDPDATIATLMKKVKGPDFPTGGEIVSSKNELKAIYETGQGSIKLRGEWKLEEGKGFKHIVITAIPYALEKSSLVEKIADVIVSKKLPSLVDVRDESTEIVRIVLELKRDANPDLVIAYLHKHTPLMGNVSVNLTCLVPSANPDVPQPERLDLKKMLQHFLDFRFDVTEKRLQFDLAEVEKRLHILEGFEKVFDALDAIIKIIRSSDGKADAANKIMAKFKLDEEQVDAILELRLYRLAKLEILVIQQEADKKRAEQKRLKTLLANKTKLWAMVKDELSELRTLYPEKRKTRILGAVEEAEFTAEDFIIEEDAVVIASDLGWVKRQGTVKDLSTTRIKEGDRVLACVAGSTRASVAFFSSAGSAYVSRFHDVPQSTGYGDPVQKMFKFADGERLIGVYSMDPRAVWLPESAEALDGAPGPLMMAVTRQGMGFRFPLIAHKDPSTRSGRKFAKLNDGDEVVSVFPVNDGDSWVMVATSDGCALAVPVDDVAVLSGPGKGVQLIKLSTKGEVLGAAELTDKAAQAMVALTPSGKRYELTVKQVLGARGGRGTVVVKSTGFSALDVGLPEVPVLGEKLPPPPPSNRPRRGQQDLL